MDHCRHSEVSIHADLSLFDHAYKVDLPSFANIKITYATDDEDDQASAGHKYELLMPLLPEPRGGLFAYIQYPLNFTAEQAFEVFIDVHNRRDNMIAIQWSVERSEEFIFTGERISGVRRILPRTAERFTLRFAGLALGPCTLPRIQIFENLPDGNGLEVPLCDERRRLLRNELRGNIDMTSTDHTLKDMPQILIQHMTST